MHITCIRESVTGKGSHEVFIFKLCQLTYFVNKLINHIHFLQQLRRMCLENKYVKNSNMKLLGFQKDIYGDWGLRC